MDITRAFVQRQFDRLDLDYVRRLHLVDDLDLNHVLRSEQALWDDSVDKFCDFPLLDARIQRLALRADDLHRELGVGLDLIAILQVKDIVHVEGDVADH